MLRKLTPPCHSVDIETANVDDIDLTAHTGVSDDEDEEDEEGEEGDEEECEVEELPESK